MQELMKPCIPCLWFYVQASNCAISNVIFYPVYFQAAQVKKGFIRGDSILSGYHAKQKNNGCSITYVTQVDPKGEFET
jgi:hypothetical protein